MGDTFPALCEVSPTQILLTTYSSFPALFSNRAILGVDDDNLCYVSRSDPAEEWTDKENQLQEDFGSSKRLRVSDINISR